MSVSTIEKRVHNYFKRLQLSVSTLPSTDRYKDTTCLNLISFYSKDGYEHGCNFNFQLYLRFCYYTTGMADPYCCLPGMEYNHSVRRCIDTGTRACVHQNCPYGFLEGWIVLLYD